MAATSSKDHEQRLLDMRKSVLDEIRDGVKEGADENKKDIGDIYDLASSERERELSLLLGHRDRQKLTQIDDALARISEGSYGECEDCGGRIGAARLKAMPFARLCVECKSQLERTTLTGPNLEPLRRFKDATVADLDDD